MKFSHISDTHLGLVQYGLEEREQDIYNSFNQAIDISINDKVDFVIFAGDVFHTPTPSGTAILQMANALKRLKQNGIESFFVLGEHDISRVRTTPIPYVYHNLEFSKYLITIFFSFNSLYKFFALMPDGLNHRKFVLEGKTLNPNSSN